MINVSNQDLDWKRDETSRILEGLGLPEQAQGEYSCNATSRMNQFLASGGDPARPASPKSTDTVQSVDSSGDKQAG